MTDSPFEVGLGVSLDEGVDGSDAAFGAFGVTGRAGWERIFSVDGARGVGGGRGNAGPVLWGPPESQMFGGLGIVDVDPVASLNIGNVGANQKNL